MPETTSQSESRYSRYAVPGEGERFGIVTCLRCGAAVLIVPRENNTGLHDDWHEALTPDRGSAS